MLALDSDELLTTTRTVRKRLDFDRPVPRELIQECLEIAFQAPNGGNMNNWRWVVIDDPALIEIKASLRYRLFELLQNDDSEHVVPYTEKKDNGAVLRHGSRSKAAEFPEGWLR